jgi:hypothetical protein
MHFMVFQQSGLECKWWKHAPAWFIYGWVWLVQNFDTGHVWEYGALYYTYMYVYIYKLLYIHCIVWSGICGVYQDDLNLRRQLWVSGISPNHGKTSRISPKNQLHESCPEIFCECFLDFIESRVTKRPFWLPFSQAFQSWDIVPQLENLQVKLRWVGYVRNCDTWNWDISPTKIMNEANIAGDIWSCKRQQVALEPDLLFREIGMFR